MKNIKQKTLYNWLLTNISILFLASVFLIIFSILFFEDSFLVMSPFILGPIISIIFDITSTIYLSKKYSNSKKYYQYTKTSDDEEWKSLNMTSLKKQSKVSFHLLNAYFLWGSIIIILVMSNVINNNLEPWKMMSFLLMFIIITTINYGALHLTNQKIKEAWK